MRLLDVLKVISMVASGVLGGLAVVTDYRDANKKLTLW